MPSFHLSVQRLLSLKVVEEKKNLPLFGPFHLSCCCRCCCWRCGWRCGCCCSTSSSLWASIRPSKWPSFPPLFFQFFSSFSHFRRNVLGVREKRPLKLGPSWASTSPPDTCTGRRGAPSLRLALHSHKSAGSHVFHCANRPCRKVHGPHQRRLRARLRGRLPVSSVRGQSFIRIFWSNPPEKLLKLEKNLLLTLQLSRGRRAVNIRGIYAALLHLPPLQGSFRGSQTGREK